jgi:hypothetical protein
MSLSFSNPWQEHHDCFVVPVIGLLHSSKGLFLLYRYPLHLWSLLVSWVRAGACTLSCFWSVPLMAVLTFLVVLTWPTPGASCTVPANVSLSFSELAKLACCQYHNVMSTVPNCCSCKCFASVFERKENWVCSCILRWRILSTSCLIGLHFNPVENSNLWQLVHCICSANGWSQQTFDLYISYCPSWNCTPSCKQDRSSSRLQY